MRRWTWLSVHVYERTVDGGGCATALGASLMECMGRQDDKVIGYEPAKSNKHIVP
jgi:hypothetical protein